MFIFVQIFTEGISLQRPVLFLATTLMNFVLIKVTDRRMHLCYLHAPLSIVTFATFVFNPPTDYQKTADHLSLMVGFISTCYLSATFLSRSWEITTAFQTLSTLWVYVYFT